MKVCVFGLWHLGSVTAACLADAGHYVVGLDPNEHTISDLNRAQPPLFEPGLADLVRKGIDAERLLFTSDPQDAIGDAEVVWVTFDTPVDEDDNADVESVVTQIESIFPLLKNGAVVLLSSQLPVGTAKRLEDSYAASENTANVVFAVSPENLRLVKAIQVFTEPDRVVIGVRDEATRTRLTELFAPITDNIEWMSVESAEMTKHALNAFLATSVAFANEVAALCEQVGAEAKEVERGLKSESRIGPGAYLGPGGAFAGGTLARDIAFLGSLAGEHDLSLPLLSAVPDSNNAHKLWAVRRLRELLNGLGGKHVAMLGLTYKPGTDTLRRSLAVEMAKELVTNGAMVHAHDPAVTALPDGLNEFIELYETVDAALDNASAVVIATQWPDYRDLPAEVFSGKVVLDANGFLRDALADAPDVQYLSVGKAK
jgi:UDPglucose 6-dehydrogenase